MNTANLNKIYQSAIKLLIPLTPELTYKTIIDEAKNLVGAESGSIFLLNNGVLVREYSSVPLDKRFEPRREGNLYNSFRDRKIMIVSLEKMGRVHPEIYKSNTRTIFLIPLHFNNKPFGVLALRSNLSHRTSKKREKYLELFGSLASLTIRNTELYNDMKKALETKGLFLSMASHELKTPLTTISGYGQLISKNINEGKTVNSEWVGKINEQTFRLTKLINELLVVNELRIGKVHPQWQQNSLTSIIKSAKEELLKLYPNRKIVMSSHIAEAADELMADRDKLTRVFVNVLHNALKFSPQDTLVFMEIKKYKDKYEIIISDDGIGILEDDLPYIFDEFYKGSNHMEQGMGLGLFVSRKVLNAHRGSIALSSAPGKKTVAKIKLPTNLVG